MLTGSSIHLSFGSKQADSQAWSDQDTLLLLEGLELFKDNWADIAEHVGKSQVGRFLVTLFQNFISISLYAGVCNSRVFECLGMHILSQLHHPRHQPLQRCTKALLCW